MIQETEIKYRFWNTDHTEHPWMEIGDTGDIKFVERSIGKHKMLFTGLKDKNNKDIYEGDITITANGKTSVVQFGNWEIARDYDHGMETQYGIGFNWDGEEPFGECKNGGGSQYEVIGNIYETPELLK